MPDYSNTIIYKLCCKDASINETYVGSTCNFNRRKSQHKYRCNNETDVCYNLKVYQFIRKFGGWENWNMIMIYEASLKNKLEKEKLERDFIEQIKPKLNNNIPTRNMKEYYKVNKTEMLEKNKKYRKENKEKISVQKKLYAEANKEKIKEYLSEYTEKHKEHLSSLNKQKIICECGVEILKYGLNRHMKSKKHLNNSQAK